MITGYRDIWIFHNGEVPVDENGDSYHIHHLDGDRENNCIDNLVALSPLSHFYIHYEQGDYMAASILAKQVKDYIPEGMYFKIKYLAGQASSAARILKEKHVMSPYEEILKGMERSKMERKLRYRFPKQTKCSLGCCKECNGKNRSVISLLSALHEKYKY